MVTSDRARTMGYIRITSWSHCSSGIAKKGMSFSETSFFTLFRIAWTLFFISSKRIGSSEEDFFTAFSLAKEIFGASWYHSSHVSAFERMVKASNSSDSVSVYGARAGSFSRKMKIWRYESAQLWARRRKSSRMFFVHGRSLKAAAPFSP